MKTENLLSSIIILLLAVDVVLGYMMLRAMRGEE